MGLRFNGAMLSRILFRTRVSMIPCLRFRHHQEQELLKGTDFDSRLKIDTMATLNRQRPRVALKILITIADISTGGILTLWCLLVGFFGLVLAGPSKLKEASLP